MTTRLRHELVGYPAVLRLSFANWYNDGGRDTPGPNAVTVSVSVEAAGQALRHLSFGGCPTVTLEPGATATSDAIEFGGTITACTTTTRVAPCDGSQIPLGPEVDTSAGESVQHLGWEGAEDGPVRFGFGPTQILGIPATGVRLDPCVLVDGDSNAVGFGDRRGSAEHLGWARRLLDGRGPVVNVSTSGATAQGALAAHAVERRNQLLSAAIPGIAAVALGTNDLQRGGSLKPVQAALSRYWRHLAGEGWRVVAVTIPPVTDSDDGWASPQGQTCAPGHRERRALNEWLRSRPAPVDAVWDLAEVVEAEPQMWRPGMTLDGIHLSPLGHTAVAAHLGHLLP